MKSRFPVSISISVYFFALYSVCCLSACEQGNHTEKSRDGTVVILPLVIGLKAVLPALLKESSGRRKKPSCVHSIKGSKSLMNILETEACKNLSQAPRQKSASPVHLLLN